MPNGPSFFALFTIICPPGTDFAAAASKALPATLLFHPASLPASASLTPREPKLFFSPPFSATFNLSAALSFFSEFLDPPSILSPRFCLGEASSSDAFLPNNPPLDSFIALLNPVASETQPSSISESLRNVGSPSYWSSGLSESIFAFLHTFLLYTILYRLCL